MITSWRCCARRPWGADSTTAQIIGIACKILRWNKTASLRDMEVKNGPEPTSACFIPRVRLQFRKPEPQIRLLSGPQLLDVPVMQEPAIMRRLITAALFIALALFPPVAPTQTKFPEQSQSPGPQSSKSRRVIGCLSPSIIEPPLSRLPCFLMHPYLGALCFELFRTDFITLPGEMKCPESCWKKVLPSDGSSLVIGRGGRELDGSSDRHRPPCPGRD